jgi:hypothetical protein
MFILKKSREITYVLLRVSVYIRRSELRQRIERYAFQLLEEASLNNFEKMLETTRVLKAFIRFGKQIYEIEPLNAAILINELSTLNTAIRQFAGLDKLPDLESLFSKPSIINKNKENNSEISSKDRSNNEPEEMNIANSIIRQSAILEKIKSSEDVCQLKDLIILLPGVSERTLRYDLQKLVSQGLVNKIGSSGPGTSYTIK